MKKSIVFITNAVIVLIGVVLIRNYEKNKSGTKTDLLADFEIQNPEIEVSPSELDGTDPASIVNDAVNQADSSVSNVIDNSNLQAPPVAPAASNTSSNATSSGKKSSTTKKSSSSSKKSSASSPSSSSSSTPKTKTS